MTVRASILANAKGTIEAISGIEQVEAGKWSEVDLRI